MPPPPGTSSRSTEYFLRRSCLVCRYLDRPSVLVAMLEQPNIHCKYTPTTCSEVQSVTNMQAETVRVLSCVLLTKSPGRSPPWQLSGPRPVCVEAVQTVAINILATTPKGASLSYYATDEAASSCRYPALYMHSRISMSETSFSSCAITLLLLHHALIHKHATHSLFVYSLFVRHLEHSWLCSSR